MDLLSIITLAALVVAFAMVIITARLLRDERRRSEARIAALSEVADSDWSEGSLAEILRRRVEPEPPVARWPQPRVPTIKERPAAPAPTPRAFVDDLELY